MKLQDLNGKLVIANLISRDVLGKLDIDEDGKLWLLDPVCPVPSREMGNGQIQFQMQPVDPIDPPDRIYVGHSSFIYAAGEKYSKMHDKFQEDFRLAKSGLIVPGKQPLRG